MRTIGQINIPPTAGSSPIPVGDLAVIAALIGLDVVARLVPHPPDFTPVAASALFAASVLRVRSLALLVPLIGLALGDAVHGFYDWRIMLTVYGALSLPALAAYLPNRLRGPHRIVAAMMGCSLVFFVVTNFAVWAFGAMYPMTPGGLVRCYAAALPFLKYTIGGDLTWIAVLFGIDALLRRGSATLRRSIIAAA